MLKSYSPPRSRRTSDPASSSVRSPAECVVENSSAMVAASASSTLLDVHASQQQPHRTLLTKLAPKRVREYTHILQLFWQNLQHFRICTHSHPSMAQPRHCVLYRARAATRVAAWLLAGNRGPIRRHITSLCCPSETERRIRPKGPRHRSSRKKENPSLTAAQG